MKKFKILMPCYNDWSSVFKLLNNIDTEISKIDGEFSVVIVNDGSNEKMSNIKPSYKNIKKVEIINMKINQGHTRSNATGLKYLSKKENFDFLILMDGDGEDRPEEIKLLAEKALKNNNSVVAKRIKRSEGIIFSILYNVHKIITIIFTGKNMNFGHYSCLKKSDIDIISNKKSLWGNFSGTLKKFIYKLDSIPCIRGSRYVQPSKMSLIKLIIHSFSILGVFKIQVLLRSLFFLIILFLVSPNFYGIIFGTLIVIFAISVFIVSTRESKEGLLNSEKNIDNVQTIYTKRL